MSLDEGNGHDGHEHGNGHPYRALMEDPDLADQYEALVSAAHVKGFSDEEIGFGLFSATVETLLANGESECCVMQLLVDFMSSYYDYWHGRMSDEVEPEPDEEDPTAS